jgi:hypothetical protein
MVTKPKMIKAVLGFQKSLDPDLLKQLNTVHGALDGNKAFSTPPIDMATFKSGIDTFTTLVTDAEDGGKKAIAAKKKQRAVMVKMLVQLGHYVEGACNDDPQIFGTSGFAAVSTTRTPSQPLPPAQFEWIDRGPGSGQVVLKPKKLPKAVSYDVRYAVVGNSGTLGPWTSTGLPGSKKAIITNLTPATNYAFQIRALGQLGYTDWSDSKMFVVA